MKVYKLNDDFEEIMVLLNEEQFEIKNVCESYANYGQIIGCYDAGCYSLNNSGSSFFSDLCKELNIETEERYLDEDELIEMFPDKKDKILQFIAENTNHSEHECYEFWNGSNWKTLVLLNDEGLTDLSEIDVDDEEKILAAFKKYDTYIQYGSSQSEDIDGYTFSNSRMQDDFPIAWVENSYCKSIKSFKRKR